MDSRIKLKLSSDKEVVRVLKLFAGFIVRI
jgi:hypothetical protein